MRRFFLIMGTMIVLMIVPQTTVWAEDAEFTPAQMKQIRKMFEEWSAQQRQQQPPPSVAAPSPAPRIQKGDFRAGHGGHHKTVNPIRHGLLGW